jgi:ketosteroid isomerase-like protein
MTKAASGPPPIPEDAPPFATPEAAQDAFYAAFDATNLDAMSLVWGDGPDILCIHPGGGLLMGKAAVIRSWQEIFAGAEPPSITIEPLAAMGSGDLAIRVLTESIRPNGRAAETATRVLATNVFQLQEGSWQLVQHHASLPLRIDTAATPDHRVH